jgi:hypothetical protein
MRTQRSPQERTLRLVFAYHNAEMELIDRRSVEMVAPPTDGLVGRPETGFWYELRSSDEQVLYRRLAQNPMRVSAEVLTEDRERPIARERLSEVRGEFVLHVPDLLATRSLVFFASPQEPARLSEPAEEVGRVELTEEPGQGSTK